MVKGRIVVLGIEELSEAGATLADAFSTDPLMHFLFNDDPHGIGALTGFACAYRFAVDWPVLGLRMADGSLGGVAGYSLPGNVPDPAAFDATEARFRAAIDPQAWNRYEAYLKAASIGAPETRCHYLGIIGVRRSLKGTGCGRVLIDAVHERAASDPESEGVWLDTELPANVRWYERRGYRVRAVNRLGNVVVSLMFRPREQRV